ncbi:fibrous sheath CABYR-binding protein-like [Patiria miniata]|uniref:Uncharacterized protein n=1 Tax=Patiria miniata TaxID=46514 RepID=A0A914ACP3_PATMI|nr:fibrous sheath CABYR-binding protein-like [Patiria miniata]
MAETETAATPDTTQEIADPTKNKVEETNNNSEEMPQAAEKPAEDEPAASEEEKPKEEKSGEEDSPPSQEAEASEPASEQNIPQTDGGGEEATPGETDAKEADDSPDAASEEAAAKQEEPKQDEESAREDAAKDEAKEEEAVKGEDAETKQEDIGVEEMPKEEKELGESEPEKVMEEGGTGKSSELVEADAAPGGENRVDDEAPAEDAKAPAEDAEAPVEDAKVPEVVAEAPEIDAEADQKPDESTSEKVPEAEAADMHEQPTDNANSNNDDKQEDRATPIGESNEENKQQTSGETEEATPVLQQDAMPEEGEQTISEAPPTNEKPSSPAPQEQEPNQETPEEAQVSATTEPDKEELTDYELKYRASQKDIEDLRSMNVEIQQRLTKSEEEAKDRKRRGSEKDGMKVQADYMARELSQQQDTEKFLREKLAEVLEEKEESERKCKDLQLRLKRFAKDDQAKDERMTKMESELREISREVQVMEDHLDQETLRKIKAGKGGQSTNGEATTTRTQAKQTTPVPKSKTCTIL